MPQGCVGAFPKMEVGMWPLAGLVPSSQTVGFFTQIPYVTKPTEKFGKK